MSSTDEPPNSGRFRDWAHLLPDILTKITTHLDEILDLVRFRAVHPSWRSTPIPQNFPLKLPWLLLPKEESHRDDGYLRFASISQNGLWMTPLLEFRFHEIAPSPYAPGWLVTADYETGLVFEPDVVRISLVNPLTLRQIQLPPLPCRRSQGGVHNFMLVKSNTDDDDDNAGEKFSLVVPASNWSHLFVWCSGELSWRSTTKVPKSNHRSCSLVLHRRSLFLLDRTRMRAQVFDMNSLDLVSDRNLALPHVGDCKFVEMPSGELLLVYDQDEFGAYPIYRLDESGDNENGLPLRWLKVHSIGDATMFMDMRACLASSDFMGSKADCIYFLNPVSYFFTSLSAEDELIPNSDRTPSVRMYEIGSGRVVGNVVEGDLFRFWYSARWFIPSLR